MGVLKHSDFTDVREEDWGDDAIHLIGGQPDMNIVREATWIVAASDASTQSKTEADYLCDGTNDDVDIQSAINALPSMGGTICLSEGTFYIGSSPIITGSKSMRILGSGVNVTTLKQTDGANLASGNGTPPSNQCLIVVGRDLNQDGSIVDTTDGLEVGGFTLNFNRAGQTVDYTTNMASECPSGIRILEVAKSHFHNIRVTGVPRAAFYPFQTYGCSFTDIYVDDSGSAFMVDAGVSTQLPCENNIIERFSFTTGVDYGGAYLTVPCVQFEAYAHGNFLLQGTIKDCLNSGVNVNLSNYVNIRGVNIVNPEKDGIIFDQSGYGYVSGIYMEDVGYVGIRESGTGSGYTRYLGNTINGTGKTVGYDQANGMSLISGSGYDIVSGNIMKDTAQWGIYMEIPLSFQPHDNTFINCASGKIRLM